MYDSNENLVFICDENVSMQKIVMVQKSLYA